jgi:excisionase family DNA binding protein
MKPSNLEPALMTIENFRSYSNLGRTKTYELISSGELHSVRVGRRRFIPTNSARAWVESLSAKTAA